MIILREKQIVIVTPPKTASRAVSDALCGREPYRGWLTIGPSMGGRIDHHTTIAPCGYERFRMLVLVRHPLDRLVSLWCHLVDDGKRQGTGCMAFYTFAAHVGRGDVGTVAGDPFYGWNLTKHLEGMAPEFSLLRYESLRQDLEAAGLPVGEELQVVGKSNGRGPWRAYYDAAILAAVEAWARPDCERLGYEWPVPGQGGA